LISYTILPELSNAVKEKYLQKCIVFLVILFSHVIYAIPDKTKKGQSVRLTFELRITSVDGFIPLKGFQSPRGDRKRLKFELPERA